MIEYELRLETGQTHRFSVDPERRLPLVEPAKAPAWTCLSYERCTNCPLPTDDPEASCPAAVDASGVTTAFRSVLSYAVCDVIVTSPEREYRRRCDVQTALQALLGLIMATSGCPVLSVFRPLAYFHLPFATKEETVFRSTTAWLMRQHFIKEAGGEPDLDFEGLRQLYEDLQEVNRCFTDRVRAAADKDANLNALVQLFSLSALVSYTLDDELEKVRALFDL